MVLCPEDCPIDNPQKLLTCLLCKLKGEFTVTGRLIPYKLNMYVHTSCAIWTDEVFDIDDQQIINFYQQQKKRHFHLQKTTILKFPRILN